MLNFAYILGFFQCRRASRTYVPGIGYEMVGLETCDGGDTIHEDLIADYVLYEPAPGHTLNQADEEWKEPAVMYVVLLQLTLALRTAYRLFNFYHGDLHYENVL